MDTLSSNDEKLPVFSPAISEAFAPYLSLWVESQDKYVSTCIISMNGSPLNLSGISLR